MPPSYAVDVYNNYILNFLVETENNILTVQDGLFLFYLNFSWQHFEFFIRFRDCTELMEEVEEATDVLGVSGSAENIFNIFFNVNRDESPRILKSHNNLLRISKIGENLF